MKVAIIADLEKKNSITVTQVNTGYVFFYNVATFKSRMDHQRKNFIVTGGINKHDGTST